MTRKTGLALLVTISCAVLGAPVLAPHGPDEQFRGLLNAPPTLPHLVDERGVWHAPFIYAWRLADRLEQRYEQDRSVRVPLAWFAERRLVRSSDPGRAPVMLAGTDSFGRDVFGRLLYGGRISLGLALLAALGATILGAFVGGLAGYFGGFPDEALMRASELVLVLPTIYVALTLRAVLPLVLAPSTVFLMLAAIFAILGAPIVARGVRTIVRSEARLEYALAARSLGASRARVLFRHLLPASAGYIVVQVTVLVPAFIMAEATLSYVGLGFPDPVASWGAMLHEAASLRALADFPWLLSPAVAIFIVVLGLNLVLQRGGDLTTTSIGPAGGQSSYNAIR